MEFLTRKESDGDVGGGSKPGANGAVEHPERNRPDGVGGYGVDRCVSLVNETISRP